LSDDTVRLSLVGQVLRRRWRTLSVLVVLGAAVGAGAGFLLAPGYSTTASVLLQGPRQPDELLTQAQVATSSVVLDRSAAALGWQVSGADLLKSVTASVADGNVVKISTTAETAERAQQLANEVAQEFVKYSTQLLSNSTDSAAQLAQGQREALRQQVAQTNQRITDLSRSVSDGETVESVQARTALQALRTSLEQAMNNLNAADTASGQGNMVVMGSAERPLSPAAPTLTQFIGGGALLFLLLGVLGHLFAARTDRRLRDETEIGAALGSAVLANLEVPDSPEAAPANGPLARLRRLVREDRPWDLPTVTVSADELSSDLRYRRALARFGGSPRLLLLVPEGDVAAREVADRLLAVADGRGPVLRVTEVAATRPIVPDPAGENGVLVVLTAGTRTAWELVGIAEACADAGQPVAGAVLARPVRIAGRKAEPAKGSQEPVPEDNDVMAGSA
jgi:capsular polysaccharide biosynthesis protein